MSIEYVDLVDYVAIAAEITGLDTQTLAHLPGLSLAESALHAPCAGFGDEEFYPDFVEKAAVLLVRLVQNHPLPDGNKRTAWVALRLFVEVNGWSWKPMPSVDDAERAVLGIAAGDGQWRPGDSTSLQAGTGTPDPTSRGYPPSYQLRVAGQRRPRWYLCAP